MWFAKWFGGREEIAEDDEPARFTAPVPVQRPETKPRPAVSAKPAARAEDTPKGGFDPYNSGSFERSNAWERVTKR
jgi:hypothetical protein